MPSIVFGLLGLAVFIGFFGLPRSAPLVGALVLTLLTLPTIIIASRAALKAVPPSIREAALGMGASKIQMVTHHVLPLAMPGMLTGTIIGMARALGESAPLLMIGMVAFIVDVPKGITDPSTVLPVQVFLWSDSPERGFVEKHFGRDHRAAGVPRRHEHDGSHSSQTIRTTVVKRHGNAAQVERAGINLKPSGRDAGRPAPLPDTPVESRARPSATSRSTTRSSAAATSTCTTARSTPSRR